MIADVYTGNGFMIKPQRMKMEFKHTELFVFCIFITLLACNQDDVSPAIDREICNNVLNENFEATIPLMNSYLQGLERNDDGALEKFENWLNSVSCVTNATILCNSCMFSLPPQSAMQVVFDS